MPLANIRDRGNRLKAFVEARAPDGQVQPSHDITINVEDGDGEVHAASITTNQEILESLKIPLPKAGRPSEIGTRKQLLDRGLSLHRVKSPAPLSDQEDEPDRLEQMLAGSELGDSFMQSGLTTPVNEVEDLQQAQYALDRASPVGRGNSKRFESGRATQVPNKAAFELGDDLYMSVVTGPRRHYPVEMADGFAKTVVDTQRKTDSYASNGKHELRKTYQKSDSRLPMREVRVPKPHRTNGYREIDNKRASTHRRYDYEDQPERRASTSASSAAYQDSQGLGEEHSEDDDNQSTPRGRKSGKIENLSPDCAPPLKISQLQSTTTNNKRRHSTHDYDDAALRKMKFNDLQHEPFDLDPAVVAAKNGSPASDGTLSQRLEQCHHQGTAEQRNMFANMSLAEWEDAGDWFAEQFTNIMHKLRESRRAKRRLIERFESEAATREAAVRSRSDNIDRKLQKMREDGLKVVGDKVFN